MAKTRSRDMQNAKFDETTVTQIGGQLPNGATLLTFSEWKAGTPRARIILALWKDGNEYCVWTEYQQLGEGQTPYTAHGHYFPVAQRDAALKLFGEKSDGLH